MRSAEVYYNDVLAGILSEDREGYHFTYDTAYITMSGARPVSLTLPLQEAPHKSSGLFPAFANRLSEGSNKALQCRMFKIDEQDLFGLLLATGGNDSIGPLTIKQQHARTRN